MRWSLMAFGVLALQRLGALYSYPGNPTDDLLRREQNLVWYAPERRAAAAQL